MTYILTLVRSLEGRAVAVLLGAVLVMHAGETLLYRRSAASLAEHAFAREVGNRLKVAREAMSRRPVNERSEEANALSTAHFEMRWSHEVSGRDGVVDPALKTLHHRILAFEPSLGPTLSLSVEKPDDPLHVLDMVGSISLPNEGGSLTFRSAHAPGIEQHEFWKRLSFLMTALVALSALALMHWIANPLRKLARATARIGRGETVRVPEVGPNETRNIAGALNAMQDRIQRLIEERTQALAAVSHDLRTPIGRLRLRLDGPFDEEQRAWMSTDLDDMLSMIDSTLAYLRGDTDPEQRQVVNLASLAMTVADAFADTGKDVTYDGPPRALARVRPTAMRRAVSNLVDNATRYGTKAQLVLSLSETQVVLTVDDDGPGIPPADIGRSFEPFVRLDSSRNRDAGGTGLGLTIARQVIMADHGTLELSNIGVGLRAEITFDRVSATKA